MGAFVEYLQKQYDPMVEMLRSMVEIESPSTCKQAVNKLADYLAPKFQEIGAAVQIIEQENSGNHLLASWGTGEEQILVLCHMDTVWQVGEIKKRPFRIEGDKAFGPGVFDMKGGLVQAYFALKALINSGKHISKKIVFLCTSDEEIGSQSSRALIEEQAAKSTFVLVPEPAVGPEGAVKRTRKGWGLYHLTVTGKSAHAGNDHDKGISAIEEISRQIIRLHAMTDYVKGTTVNVGFVNSGTLANVVADRAEAKIDLRAMTQTELERAEHEILGLQPFMDGTTVKITGQINRPPLESTVQNRELYEKAKRIARNLGLDLGGKNVGGVSDGNFTSALGIPTLDGIGAVGDGAHALHEYVLLNCMVKRATLIAELFVE
ncbi:M20 family metallopeptidase [Paradesulfitobacterium aromaticivorans]